MAMMPMMMMMPMVTVPVMVMPAHFDRLHPADAVLRYDGLFNCRRHVCQPACERRHRSSLCACGKHDRARGQSSTEIQEVPRFHDVMPLSRARIHSVLPAQDEPPLNPFTVEPASAQDDSSVTQKSSDTNVI